MKTKFYNIASVLICLMVCWNCKSVTKPENLEINLKLNSITFANNDIGYAVGGDGIILKTTDNGENWVQLESGVDHTLIDVFFTNPNKGIIVGEMGMILRTTNGGQDWQIIESDVPQNLYAVHFPSDQTGFIAGDGVVLKTQSGGNSWSKSIFYPSISNHYGITYFSVYFNDPNNGWVAADGGFMFTTNGGENWEGKSYISCCTDLYSMVFVNENVAYVTRGVSLLRTFDGGQYWELVGVSSSQALPEIILLFDLSFPNVATGWVVGEAGRISKTTDSGDNWTVQESGVSHDLMSVHFLNTTTGFVSGDNRTILKTTDGGDNWRIVHSASTN